LIEFSSSPFVRGIEGELLEHLSLTTIFL